MPSQNGKPNKNTADKPARACAAHMREMPCPICKDSHITGSQPVGASNAGAWVSVPANHKSVPSTRDSRVCSVCGGPAHTESGQAPTRSTPRPTAPANVMRAGGKLVSYGKANVTAADMFGAHPTPNKPTAKPQGHPAFVGKPWRKNGQTFGMTRNGSVWAKGSSADSKWHMVESGARSGRNGVSNRKPGAGEFCDGADTVIGLNVPRAGTVGTVNRSPFPHRI